jgi:hypothetical protein
VKRLLYQALLYAHPPVFRRRFASEMQWIFDQTTPIGQQFNLILDAFVSLQRQWIVRRGVWKVLAAVFGAAVEMAMAGILVASSTPQGRSPAPIRAGFGYDHISFSAGVAVLLVCLIFSITRLYALERWFIRR